MHRLISTTALLGFNYCHHPAYWMMRAASTTAANTKISKPNVYSADTLAAKDNISDDNKATPEQLALVSEKLTRHLPRFFSEPHDFSMYANDVVVIDNIRNIRIQGSASHAMHVVLFKIYHHINYSSVRLELLNLVRHPEESCVKIRWRIVKRPGLFYTILFFYKNKQDWKDGLSTMYVNKEGKIYCHVCDNIDVETDDTKIKKEIKNPVVV